MTHLKFITVFIFLSVAEISMGQASKENITSSFFKNYQENPTKAYIDLFSTNKWMKDKKSDLETVKIKLADLLASLGDYYGYEPITEKSLGESYILKSFLIKYERQPLRFTFLLYKPKDTWQIQNFTFDSSIDDELGEAAKAYRLKNNW